MFVICIILWFSFGSLPSPASGSGMRRGVGGIFFDDFKSNNQDAAFNFVKVIERNSTLSFLSIHTAVTVNGALAVIKLPSLTQKQEHLC